MRSKTIYGDAYSQYDFNVFIRQLQDLGIQQNDDEVEVVAEDIKATIDPQAKEMVSCYESTA
jgi:hypothetical protein